MLNEANAKLKRWTRKKRRENCSNFQLEFEKKNLEKQLGSLVRMKIWQQ